jgi:hypothetical protein
MAKKKGKKLQEETLDRHYDAEGRDKYKKEAHGIPGRESY